MSRPTGELSVELPEESSRARSRKRWRDTQRWTVEGKLGDVLREIEGRARQDEAKHVAEAEGKARRQREWEHAMTRARERLIQDHRVAALDQQLEEWTKVQQIRKYCHALDTALTEGGLTDEKTREWVAWARAHADAIDPVTNYSDVVPDDPKINAWDLRPYLGRWSPYGPGRS